MGQFSQEGLTLVWQENQQKVWLQPWGKNGLRCQANLAGKQLDLPQALLKNISSNDGDVAIEISETKAIIRSGLIQATLSRSGCIRYSNAQSAFCLKNPMIHRTTRRLTATFSTEMGVCFGLKPGSNLKRMSDFSDLDSISMGDLTRRVA